MTMTRRHAALLAALAGLLPATPAGAQDAGWTDTIDLGAIFRTQAAVQTGDGHLQKLDVILQPELSAWLGDDLKLTAIGRARFDPADELEPGRPDQDMRAAPSRRLLLGDATDLELRELFVDTTLGDTFLRLGKQQVVWGQADGIRVLDLVNPLSYREFILPSYEDRRIPLWTVNAEVPVGSSLLQLLWIPDQTYDDLPEAGAPFAMTAPSLVPRRPTGIPVTVREPERPDDPIGDSDVGARLTTFVEGWDLSLNYLYHYHDQVIPFREATGAGVVVTPRYERSHLIGGTFSNAFGSTTLRGEVGYNTDRYFVTADAADADGVSRSDELAYVLGLDYNGLTDTLVSGQLFQSVLTDREPGVVRDRVETTLTLLVRRTFLNQVVTAEALAIHNLNNGDGVVQLDLDYLLRSNVSLSLGADQFYGGSDGVYGQFRDASRVTFRVEIGF